MKSTGDTIFALSSGRGRSGVAVVRVSGDSVRFVLETMCGGVPAERTAALRVISETSGEAIDRGVVLYFAGPRSFTGEDLAELQVHGGRAVVDALLEELGSFAGLRPAEAGEFARRAFENGKLDLTAVEGLADLIDSETEGQRRAAMMQAEGALARNYSTLRKQALELRALAEAAVDFVDEGDVPGSVTEEIRKGSVRLHAALDDLVAGFSRGQRVREGLVVAIVGKPNAGKSSLVNWLANRDIAIVSDEAGTTRDLLEARLNIAGVAVSVFDTAGLRESPGRVEAEGIRRAKDLMQRADLVIELIDSGSLQNDGGAHSEDKSGDNFNGETWRYGSRSDLGASQSVAIESLSTVTGEGMKSLMARLEEFAVSRAGYAGEALMTHERHKRNIDEALVALDRCMDHLDGETFELAAEELRLVGDALGRLTGTIHTEDVLGEIFSSFCIGK